MSEATNRADFESAMKALGWGPSGFTEMRDGEYIAMHARAAWDAWQARGASIAVAYRYRWSDTDAWDYSAVCHSDDGVFGGYQCEPLYTAPPAAPITVEPLKRIATWLRDLPQKSWAAHYWRNGMFATDCKDAAEVLDGTAPPADTVNAELVAALRAVVAFVEGVPDAPEPFGIARAALSRASTEGTPK